MASQLQIQHQARQDRLHRFAQAATKHERSKLEAAQMCIPAAPVVNVVIPMTRAPDNAPLSWKILRAVAEEFDMTVSQMRCTSQCYQFVFPRHFAVGLLTEMTNLSNPKIGLLLGGRDHTTVLNSKRRFEAIAAVESIRNRLDQMKVEILK